MKRRFVAVLMLIGVGLLGDYWASQPPAWLYQDPIVSPLGFGAVDSCKGPRTMPVDGGPTLVTPERPLDINRASAEELMGLPRIGPVLAVRIVSHRDSVGAFIQPEELLAIRGIGPATLARLLPLILIEAAAP